MVPIKISDWRSSRFRPYTQIMNGDCTMMNIRNLQACIDHSLSN